MYYANYISLAAAVIALLGSLLALYIGSDLAIKKERRQLLWSKELDRVLELEESAGILVEQVGAHRGIPDDPSLLAERMSALEQAAGRFGRYPQVRHAVLDLHNVLGRLFSAKRGHEDTRSIR